MPETDTHANKLKAPILLARGADESVTQSDDRRSSEVWGFARNARAPEADLESECADAMRRVTRLSAASGLLLELLMEGCGKSEMLSSTGLAPAQLDDGIAALLAELDAGSVTDAIRIAIYADCRRS